MKRKEYIKPAVRVRPFVTEGTVMDTFPIVDASMEDDTLAKEHSFDDEDFEYPEGKSVWED